MQELPKENKTPETNIKPGPAQVGAISKAQKWQNDFQVSSILFYSTRKSKIFRKKISKKLHNQKNRPIGALKSHNAEKLKGGTFLRFFNILFVAKHGKN